MPTTCLSIKEVGLLMYMRLLWNEHIAWTRMAITAIVFHLPSTNATVTRLLQNAVEMGNSLKPFYGDQIGDMYGNLIRKHLVIGADFN